MTLYYNEKNDEFEVIEKLLRWKKISINYCKSSKYTKPTLVSNEKILGEGFFGIVKYIDK